MSQQPIPRLPVFGWQALRGGRAAAAPCVLDLPNLVYSTSGRASILLALEALGTGPGDEVLLPTYHCPTMVAPAAGLRAVPRFYPIDGRGGPDLAWLGRQDLGRVRALLAAHYFGLPQPMATLRRWCDERGIALIEDCAHALFGSSDGRPVGAWGDIAIASLTKFLPVPEGGCLVLNAPARPSHPPRLTPCPLSRQLGACVDILEVGARQGELTGMNTLVVGGLRTLRKLRSAAGAPEPGAAVRDDSAVDDTAPGDSPDFTVDHALAHRAPATACRWIGSSLPRARIVSQRRAHYLQLLQQLSGHRGLRPLLPEMADDAAPYVFALWVDDPDPGYAELRRRNMPVFRWDRLWPGVLRLPGDHGLLWSHHVLQLACHQDMSSGQLDAFIAAVLELYARPPRSVTRTSQLADVASP